MVFERVGQNRQFLFEIPRKVFWNNNRFLKLSENELDEVKKAIKTTYHDVDIVMIDSKDTDDQHCPNTHNLVFKGENFSLELVFKEDRSIELLYWENFRCTKISGDFIPSGYLDSKEEYFVTAIWTDSGCCCCILEIANLKIHKCSEAFVSIRFSEFVDEIVEYVGVEHETFKEVTKLFNIHEIIPK